MADRLNDLMQSDTLHQVAAGTTGSSVVLITQTDINTIKAVLISALLSGLIQLTMRLLKKLRTKYYGNNLNQTPENSSKED